MKLKDVIFDYTLPDKYLKRYPVQSISLCSIARLTKLQGYDIGHGINHRTTVLVLPDLAPAYNEHVEV